MVHRGTPLVRGQGQESGVNCRCAQGLSEDDGFTDGTTWTDQGCAIIWHANDGDHAGLLRNIMSAKQLRNLS
jgi:hypothetical protein